MNRFCVKAMPSHKHGSWCWVSQIWGRGGGGGRIEPNRLFAQCVSWCRTKTSPVGFLRPTSSSLTSCRMCHGKQSFVLGQPLQCGFWMERPHVGAAVFWDGVAGPLVRPFTLNPAGLMRTGSSQGGCCPSSGAALPKLSTLHFRVSHHGFASGRAL